MYVYHSQDSNHLAQVPMYPSPLHKFWSGYIYTINPIMLAGPFIFGEIRGQALKLS